MLNRPAPLHRPSALLRHRSARRGAAGFALIEALIAILIFSFGALGLVGLQVTMLRATNGAKYRADATFLANDLIGRMWADTQNLSSYSGTTCTYAPCQSWRARLARTLPQGDAALTYDASTGNVGVTILWTVPDEAQHSFTTQTAINP
jgi:type IV pilus assembly protein PilV